MLDKLKLHVAKSAAERRALSRSLSIVKPGLEAGGSSLGNAIKAQVYLTNIDDPPEFMDVWSSHFGAVRTKLPIPDCSIVMDMWA